MTSPQDDQQDDDTIVWQRLARGIKAYAPEARPARQPKSPRARPKQPRAVKAMPISPPPSRRPAPDPIDLRKGEHAGIDGATRRRLAQGQVTIESRLDLHGLTAAQAERRLARFIDGAARAGQRCILVITGKGPDGKGVLRRLVPLWLKTPPLSTRILAISQASPADGGGGALYVMLRRKRDST